MSFHEMKTKNLPSGDQTHYSQCKAVVHMVKNTNALYKACPQQDCNKKVVDNENGVYRCEKCNTDFPNFKWRLLLNVSSVWLGTNKNDNLYDFSCQLVIGLRIGGSHVFLMLAKSFLEKPLKKLGTHMKTIKNWQIPFSEAFLLRDLCSNCDPKWKLMP